MTKGKIISIGSINKDIQVRSQRWPEIGETLPVTDLLTLGGGKGANRAFITQKFNAPTMLIGRVGDDREGEEILQPLKELGVDVAQVKKMEGQRSGISMIIVDEDGNKTIMLAQNANNHWEKEAPDHVESLILNAPDNSLLALDLEVPGEVVEKAIKAARKRGFIVILDPSPADSFKEEYLSLVDYIIPNSSEAEGISGQEINDKEDAFQACEIFAKKGAKNIIIKLGDKGYVMMCEGKKDQLSAPEAKVVDTTGAGDAFAGGLAYALWEGRDQLEALKFAVVVSAIAIETYGSQTAYPTKEDVEKRLSNTSF